MPRKPKNTITIDIALPERLTDGSYLPSDQSFHDFARTCLEEHVLEFTSSTNLAVVRNDYLQQWQAQMGGEHRENEEKESEKLTKRKEELAREREAIIAASFAKMHGHTPTSSPKANPTIEPKPQQHPRADESTPPKKRPIFTRVQAPSNPHVTPELEKPAANGADPSASKPFLPASAPPTTGTLDEPPKE